MKYEYSADRRIVLPHKKRWMQMKYCPSAASFLGWREVYFSLGANDLRIIHTQTPREKNDIYGAVNWEAGACVCVPVCGY